MVSARANNPAGTLELQRGDDAAGQPGGVCAHLTGNSIRQAPATRWWHERGRCRAEVAQLPANTFTLP